MPPFTTSKMQSFCLLQVQIQITFSLFSGVRIRSCEKPFPRNSAFQKHPYSKNLKLGNWWKARPSSLHIERLHIGQEKKPWSELFTGAHKLPVLLSQTHVALHCRESPKDDSILSCQLKLQIKAEGWLARVMRHRCLLRNPGAAGTWAGSNCSSTQ